MRVGLCFTSRSKQPSWCVNIRHSVFVFFGFFFSVTQNSHQEGYLLKRYWVSDRQFDNIQPTAEVLNPICQSGFFFFSTVQLLIYLMSNMWKWLVGREKCCIDREGEREKSSGQSATLFCFTATWEGGQSGHTHVYTHVHARPRTLALTHSHTRARAELTQQKQRQQQVRCQHITALPFFSVLLREKRSDILWSTLQKSAACNGGWIVTPVHSSHTPSVSPPPSHCF